MDLAFPGGWHVTIFHPSAWIAVAVVGLLACALVTKFFISGIDR